MFRHEDELIGEAGKMGPQDPAPAVADQEPDRYEMTAVNADKRIGFQILALRTDRDA